MKISQLQLLELVRQRKKERKDASDQAAGGMLMVSAVSSAPQPMDEGLVMPSVSFQNTYPQPHPWFRGYRRESGRRKLSQNRIALRNMQCWLCHGFGHISRNCPHSYPAKAKSINRPTDIPISTLAPGCCSHRVQNSATDFQSSQGYGTPIPSGPDIPPNSANISGLHHPHKETNCGIISLSHLEQQNPSLDSPEA